MRYRRETFNSGRCVNPMLYFFQTSLNNPHTRSPHLCPSKNTETATTFKVLFFLFQIHFSEMFLLQKNQADYEDEQFFFF